MHTQDTAYPRYRPGAYGAMVPDDHGKYVHVDNVEALARDLRDARELLARLMEARR